MPDPDYLEAFPQREPFSWVRAAPEPETPGHPFGADAPDFLNYDSHARDTHAQVRNPRGARARARPHTRVADRVFLPFWDGGEGSEAWDTIEIDGRPYPGLVKIGGNGPKLKTRARSAPGADGARIVARGYEPAKLKITLVAWTREHLDEWEQLVPRIHPANNPNLRNAFAVYHPALALLLISQVVFTEVGLVEKAPEHGAMKLDLEALQFAPPSPANRTRAVAAPSALGDVPTALPTPLATPSNNPNTAPPPSERWPLDP